MSISLKSCSNFTMVIWKMPEMRIMRLSVNSVICKVLHHFYLLARQASAYSQSRLEHLIAMWYVHLPVRYYTGFQCHL